MSPLIPFTILMLLAVAPDFGNGSDIRSPSCTARVSVGVNSRLNIRERAFTSATILGSLADGEIVKLNGRSTGEMVQGTNVWFSVRNGFVSGAFLRMLEPKPFWCNLVL